MNTQDTQRYLLFTIGQLTCGIELHQVAEVVEPPPLSPIPRAPAHFIGAMNSHGSIKAVLDLTPMAGEGRSARPAGKVLVLEDSMAALALLVDGVLTIVGAETLERQPCTDEQHWCDGLLRDGIQEIHLLSVEKLLQRLEATING